jgi:hypothetical protein
MSYHDLSECTLTNDERVAEKDKIINSLLNESRLTDNERRFIWDISTSDFVSVKQLFWLRDINNKY